MPPRTPHYGAEVTSTLRLGSPRASTHSSSLPLNLPRTSPAAMRAAALPASPVPLRSTAARIAAHPQAKRRPHLATRACRVPVVPPSTPHARPPRQPPAAGLRGKALRATVRAGDPTASRPRNRANEECASGKRVSSRAAVARAAAFGVVGSSGTFSTPDRYST
jgi:hypothetical protein